MFDLKKSQEKRIAELYKIEKEQKDKYFTKLRSLGINTYQEYLLSTYWKNIKNKMYSSNIPKICLCCGSDKYLNIHHRKYKPRDIDNPIINNYIFLCNKCHSAIHNLQKENKYLTINQATKKYIRTLRKSV